MARHEADWTYFNRRSLEELEAAKRAIDPLSQAVHFDLAARYQRLAESPDDTATERLRQNAREPVAGYLKRWGEW